MMFLGFVACSSKETSGPDAGSGGTTGHPDTGAVDTGAADSSSASDDAADEVPSTGTAPEIPATNLSCNQIRICTSSCTTDACVDACIGRGNTAGRAQYDDWAACVDPMCKGVSDFNCRCDVSCFEGSVCETQTLACAGDEVDYVCDEPCH